MRRWILISSFLLNSAISISPFSLLGLEYDEERDRPRFINLEEGEDSKISLFEWENSHSSASSISPLRPAHPPSLIEVSKQLKIGIPETGEIIIGRILHIYSNASPLFIELSLGSEERNSNDHKNK